MTNEDKGVRIEYRQWGAPSSDAVFLLVHGLGAHGGRWEAMSDFFSKRRIFLYALELKNNPQSGYFRNYYKQLLCLYGIAARDNPGRKIFLVGESMGALVSFLFTASNPGMFSGLICLSPAFISRCVPALADSVRILASLFYNPKKEFKLPFNSSMCTRDPIYRKNLDEDPREYRSVPSGLILEILYFQFRSGLLKDKIKTPVLFLIAGEDKLVKSDASRRIFNGLEEKDKALIEFPGMYHSLSIESGKEAVFEEILRWVEKRI
jgi:alpha-beta hydrolase superfamily lysophospholipase